MQEGIHIVLKADQIGTVFGIPITNTMLMGWVTMLLLAGLAYAVGHRLTKIPGKLQTFFEMIFSFVLDYLAEVLESKKLATRFLPLIATLFLFILLGNWLELVPGVESVTIEAPAAEAAPLPIVDPLGHVIPPSEHSAEVTSVPLFKPVTTDLNVTLALAIISFIVIEVVGFTTLGVGGHLSKFFNFKSVMGFFVGLIELVSELVRLVSFSFRLFGNMFAGVTLIGVAMFFVPYVLPVPLMLYEVFVGIIQASIFALLTLFFIKLAMTEAH
jgi:F-type H+-transporting ATPase subunit a